MTKKLLLIVTLGVIVVAGANSQQPGQGRGAGAFDQVEAEKIAFFTRTLELTNREAREFWPVYDEFQKKRNEIIHERQILSFQYLQNRDNLSDRQSVELADKYIDLQLREAKLSVEYHEKFKTVLPPGKVMRFYQAENEFRMHLLRRLRGGGGGGDSAPGRGQNNPQN